MSWIEELEHRLRFDCAEGHRTIFVCSAKEKIDYDAPIDCAECGAPASYAGLEPQKINITGKVAYERNGRKAYAISDGKGSVTYMSKTKYDYLETGGTVKSAYTKDYEKAVVEAGHGQQLEAQDLTKMKRRPKGGAKEVYSKMLQEDRARVQKEGGAV